MKREDDQELWDLLGEVRHPAVSPFFARNVMRRIRQEHGWREYFVNWLSPRRLIPATAFAVIAAGMSLQVLPRGGGRANESMPDSLAAIDPQDYEAVVDLDDLLVPDDDNEIWSDNESLSL